MFKKFVIFSTVISLLVSTNVFAATKTVTHYVYEIGKELEFSDGSTAYVKYGEYESEEKLVGSRLDAVVEKIMANSEAKAKEDKIKEDKRTSSSKEEVSGGTFTYDEEGLETLQSLSEEVSEDTSKSDDTEEVLLNDVIEEADEADVQVSDSEIEYLCRAVQAEAGNQGYDGKAAVCDVILNRVDSDQFPDDIQGVINAPGQFAVVANGSINTVCVDEETRNAVTDELTNRNNNRILYFRTGHYHSGRNAEFQLGAHYFSS